MGKSMMDKMKNDAEKSSAKLGNVHTEKISGISEELSVLRSSLSGIEKMKFGFDKSALHKGKLCLQPKTSVSDMRGSYFGKKSSIFKSPAVNALP